MEHRRVTSLVSRQRISTLAPRYHGLLGYGDLTGYNAWFLQRFLERLSPWPAVWACWSGAMLHISEALDGPVTLRGYEEALRCRTPTAVVDCKSLYDHATAPTSPGGTDDKRCAIDVLIIRESLGRLKCTLRWTPGDRMLADALTKNSADPADLLRSCIRRTCYQISDETSLLQHRARPGKRVPGEPVHVRIVFCIVNCSPIQRCSLIH